jgi:serine/threonine-protein kinase
MTDARLLGGRYEIGAPLGYGGMAEVHRGRDLRLGRDVAVKVLRSDLARDPGFQERFRREAQNAASLNHPAIVAVYDTGEELGGGDNNLPFIVMEYVEGRTLKEVLVAEGRLMPQRALEVTADVCAALDFSHRNGIVHRDIKPGNVMMTPNGTVKVMDFGIARAITSATAAMTQTSAVIGTAQYLSPEQARGETVDARSDVYSTGCLLYELLCGNPPFTGDNPVSVAYQHVREDPIPPSEHNPDVTPTIDAIVLKAMAKNPLNRYQSAGEMRADLLRAVAGRPVQAAPVYSAEERTQLIGGRRNGTAGIPARPVDPPRKRKALTYVLVALGVIAVFALAAFLTSYLLGKDPATVSVPAVVGKTEEQARFELEQKGFKVRAQTITSALADKGKVINQNPGAGKEANKGETVVLDIGGGPKMTEVPDLTGLKKEGAEQVLTSKKLKAAFTYKTSAEPKDSVLSWDPPKGAQVAEETVINVVLSSADLILVPDLVGLTREKAVQSLKDIGLRADVRIEITGDKTPGTVIRQDPAQKTQKPKNSTVIIWVAEAPPPSTTPPTEDPSESPSPTATPSVPGAT